MNHELLADIASPSGVFPVFLDTCILDPSIPRDVLLEAAHQQLYRPTGRMRSQSDLNAICTTMREAFPEAVVSVDHVFGDSPTCDPKDRQVLAAAILGGYDILVTMKTGASRVPQAMARGSNGSPNASRNTASSSLRLCWSPAWSCCSSLEMMHAGHRFKPAADSLADPCCCKDLPGIAQRWQRGIIVV